MWLQANGGEVMTSEKDADICLVDHLKDDTDDGMYVFLSSEVTTIAIETLGDSLLCAYRFSYRYIEKSLQEGKLEDLEAHRIVPQRKQRKVSGARPKGSKTYVSFDPTLRFFYFSINLPRKSDTHFIGPQPKLFHPRRR